MMQRLVPYLEGRIRFQAEGGRYEWFINQCEQAGLTMEKICPTSTGFTAETTPSAYKKMHRYARMSRCRIRTTEKHGLYFALYAWRKRYGIAAGLILGMLMLFCGQNLIWNICFVDFSPQQQISIREKLFENGIYEGAVHNREKLLRTCAAIFTGTEEYGWLSLNFVKGRLVVEKTDRLQTPALIGQQYTDVVAAADGRVQSVEPQGGFVCVRKGQYVAKGQMLVQGLRIGEYGRLDCTHAQAQVMAEVEKNYRCTQPLRLRFSSPLGKTKTYYKLWLPWGELALYRKIDVPPNARQTVTRRPAAPFGFHLPITIEEITVREQENAEQLLTPELAQERAYDQVLEQMRAEFGSFTILEEKKQVEAAEDALTLTMHVRFLADIARTVPGMPLEKIELPQQEE